MVASSFKVHFGFILVHCRQNSTWSFKLYVQTHCITNIEVASSHMRQQHSARRTERRRSTVHLTTEEGDQAAFVKFLRKKRLTYE